MKSMIKILSGIETIKLLRARDIEVTVGGSPQGHILVDSDDSVIGIALFSNPTEKHMHRLYTTEIKAIWTDNSTNSENISSLISSYLETNPWDCFTSIEVARGYEKSLIEAGFAFPAELRRTKESTAILEWINPSVNFYIYKITSTENPGYYIGRRVIKKAHATIEDCSKDKYMGSGGTAFKEWVSTVSPESLMKEVLSIYSSWSEIVVAEYETIGGLNKTDPACLNFLPGGVGVGRSVAHFSSQFCDEHGITLHNGNTCAKCSIKHIFSVQACPVHGDTKFRGNNCEKCKHEKFCIEKDCPTHGLSIFYRGKCQKCKIALSLQTLNCPLHGDVLHYGSVCSTCTSQKSISIKTCVIHGETKHQGTVCSTCNSLKSVIKKECSIHGLAVFQGNNCMKCNAQNQLSEKTCKTHGKSIHKGNSCTLCTAQKAISLKECKLHGIVTHQGDVCSKCNAQKSVTLKTCPIHGETKHQGDTCNKCNAQKSVKIGDCPTHGRDVKFQGGRCSSCINSSLIKMLECPVHGLTKHRGKSCYACISDKRRANKVNAK